MCPVGEQEVNERDVIARAGSAVRWLYFGTN
jgi:hypothetical protein